MTAIDVLIVGPAERSTGGIARYVAEQRDRLSDEVRIAVHDNGSTDEGRLRTAGRSLRRLAGFARRERPDVVHVHTSHGLPFYRNALYVLYAAHVWRSAVVLHVHGSSFDAFVRGAGPVGRRYQSLVFDACDAVIVLSAYWQSVLAERVPAAKLRVLPNAVDADAYDPAFDVDPPTVAFVSNHVERKGIGAFVEAVDRLKRDGAPPFAVRIAGTGPEAHRAERLAARYDDVEYLGYVSEAAKRRLLDAASVYALPTHAEGLPIALLEGMAGGNAVVTTGVGAIPEVVGEENGRLVDPGDVDGLAAALRALVEDPAATSAMGRANHRLVAEAYSWSMVAARLGRLYHEVAAGSTEKDTTDDVRPRTADA